MEIAIDEEVLESWIEWTSVTGEGPHKGIHNLLKDILMLGFLHRDKHGIVLMNGDSEAGLDEEYDAYLDKRASGMKVKY